MIPFNQVEIGALILSNTHKTYVPNNDTHNNTKNQNGGFTTRQWITSSTIHLS
jgi:hypothetical protein